MIFSIITLFPQMFCAISQYGITGRAFKRGIFHLNFFNPRDFATDKRAVVDDRPYGGGPGMVMMLEPLRSAIHAAKNSMPCSTKVIALSPQGKKINQSVICRLAQEDALILVCGRYEGIDERLSFSEIDDELSLGDYVLSGGELPSMVLIDSVVRCLPGALGKISSVQNDSFIKGLLAPPQYTRPKIVAGLQVPDVLLSGAHDKIRRWRLKQSLGRTWLRRPKLLKKLSLTQEQKHLLNEFQQEYSE